MLRLFFTQTAQIVFFLLACCQVANISARCRSTISRHACNVEFHGTSYLGPRAARLEQHVPLPKLPCGLLSDWHVDNVLGDGRCGYRSLARYLGVSFHRVLKRLLAILVESSLFPSSHIIDMMSVQDCSNTCPKSCWLNSNHIRLLASMCPDWFPDGLFVVKVHEGGRVLHFRPDGSIDSDATLSCSNACVLGLLTDSAPHFVHLRPCHKHEVKVPTLIPQPDPSIQGGASRVLSLKPLSLDALPDNAVVELLQFSLTPHMVTSFAPTCRMVWSHLSERATWQGQIFSVPPCHCQRLCANRCVRSASLASTFWDVYSPAAHLDFTLNALAKRRPMLHGWNHVFDRATGSNIWFTSTNNATPPVFTLDFRHFRFHEKILSDLLHLRVGFVGTSVPAPYQLFTSTEQSSPEELQRLAAFDFRFEDTGCGVSAWPPVPPYKSTQHDSDAAFCLTIVLNQADGLLSLFLPDGALLLERRFPSFPPSLPCSSFVYLSSQRQPGSPKPCPVRDRLKLFQPRLSQGCALSKFLPYVHLDVFHAGATTADDSADLCWVPAQWAGSFCGAEMVQEHCMPLRLPSRPVRFNLRFALTSASICTCTIPTRELQGASLIFILQDCVAAALGTSPFASRVLLHSDSVLWSEHFCYLSSNVNIDVVTLPLRTDLANDLFQAVKAGNVHSVVSCLVSGQCPNFPNSDGIAPLHAAVIHASVPEISDALLRATANVNDEWDAGESPLHLACRTNRESLVSKLLKANASVRALDCEGATPLHTAAVYAGPSCIRLLLRSSADIWARNLQGETPLVAAADSCGSPATISFLLECAAPTSWTDVLLMSLFRLVTLLGFPRSIFAVCKLLSKQLEFYPPRLSGGFCAFTSRGTCSQFVLQEFYPFGPLPRASFHGGAVPFQDTPLLLAILTFAGDMKCLLALPLAAKTIYSLLKLSNFVPPMRISIVPCICNRLCLNQCLLSLLPEGLSLQHVGTEANVDEHGCDTEAFWSIFHSLDHCQTLWMDRSSSPAVFSVQLSLSQFLLGKPALTVFLGLVTSCQPEAVGSSLLWPDHVVHTPHCVARLTVTHGMCSLLRWQTHRGQSSCEAIRQMSFHLSSVHFSSVVRPGLARIFGKHGALLSSLPLPTRWPKTFGSKCRAIVCLHCPDQLRLPSLDMTTQLLPLHTPVPDAVSARLRLRVIDKDVLHWGGFIAAGFGAPILPGFAFGMFAQVLHEAFCRLSCYTTYGDFTDLRCPSTAESISHGVYVALNFASETEETSEVFFYNAFGICDFATFFHLLPKMSICPTLRFTLACHQQRPPRSVFFVGRHYHDSTRGVNFWHTGLNNQAPKVFDVSLFLGASPCLLHAIPDLQLLIGVFASTSSASLLHVPSPDQALPFNMASARFHIRHGTCQTIDAASASSFHPADCQHTIDFHTRRSFTVVCHQQDQTFSLFDSDGERLLSLSCLLLPKDTPIKSFVCLLSPSFSLPSCAVTADVHRRPRVRATQPHLQKGYAMFHFLPHCTVIGGASLSLESGQRSLPLSFPLPCCCAAVLFDALDYCLLLSGGGDAVELSKHGKPLWCSLHDTSDESDSSAAASPLTTAVHSGAVVSLVDSLDAPDPAPTAEQVAKHQDAYVEQVIRLYADVLDSCSIRASFLQSWRDLFQLEDEDLIARCARLHSENMEWRIFFVNGAYRETPMPFSLARFLLKDMECPAVLLWNLGSHAFHLLTETEATCWHWHVTFGGFPCIAWNSFTQRYFAIPAAIPALGNCSMSSAVENSSVSVHVKILEFQPACAKVLPTEAFFSSFETSRMECLDAMPQELELDPSLAHIGRCLSPRALRQLCCSCVLSLPLGLVLWVFDSNVLLHVSPSTSLRPICLAEGLGLLQLGAVLMCCRPSFKMLNRALLQVGQVWFGSVPKSAARATLLLVHLSNLHGGFSRSCLFSFVHGGASPLEDMCFLCAVLTCAGDIKTVLALTKVSTRISSMLRPPNVFPAMRVSMSPCNCNRLCFNQCLRSLLPQGYSFKCVDSTATIDASSGGTPFLQNIAHSLDHCQTFWMSSAPTPALFTIKVSLSQLLLRKPALTVFLGLVTSCQPQAIGSSFLWPDHVVPAPHCVVRLTLHRGKCLGCDAEN